MKQELVPALMDIDARIAVKVVQAHQGRLTNLHRQDTSLSAELHLPVCKYPSPVQQ